MVTTASLDREAAGRGRQGTHAGDGEHPRWNGGERTLQPRPVLEDGAGARREDLVIDERRCSTRGCRGRKGEFFSETKKTRVMSWLAVWRSNTCGSGGCAATGQNFGQSTDAYR